MFKACLAPLKHNLTRLLNHIQEDQVNTFSGTTYMYSYDFSTIYGKLYNIESYCSSFRTGLEKWALLPELGPISGLEKIRDKVDSFYNLWEFMDPNSDSRWFFYNFSKTRADWSILYYLQLWLLRVKCLHSALRPNQNDLLSKNKVLKSDMNC